MEAGKTKKGLFVAMDGYTPGSYWNNKGYVDNFKENNGSDYGKTQKSLAKFYPNTLIMYDKSDFCGSHSSVNASLTQNDVLKYFTGEMELPDNYEIIRYDPNNLDVDKEGFIKVNYNEINSIEKVYKLFEIN